MCKISVSVGRCLLACDVA